MVPVLIDKDMFEPGYNLKFTVQNRSYVCTNLMVDTVILKKLLKNELISLYICLIKKDVHMVKKQKLCIDSSNNEK